MRTGFSKPTNQLAVMWCWISVPVLVQVPEQWQYPVLSTTDLWLRPILVTVAMGTEAWCSGRCAVSARTGTSKPLTFHHFLLNYSSSPVDIPLTILGMVTARGVMASTFCLAYKIVSYLMLNLLLRIKYKLNIYSNVNIVRYYELLLYVHIIQID